MSSLSAELFGEINYL